MKHKKRKALRAKLLNEIRTVITLNDCSLPNKIEKILKRSIKKITKKTYVKIYSVSTEKRKPVSYSDISKMDGVDIERSE